MARKYAVVWEKIQSLGKATVHCPTTDILAITNAIKKEKAQDKGKEANKILDINIRELRADERSVDNPNYTIAITFTLKTDISLRSVRDGL